MTETLKPCPFCGDKAVLKEDLRWHGAFRVECSSCDATVWATGENNPASAIAHWNRRATPCEPGEAELRDAITSMTVLEDELDYPRVTATFCYGDEADEIEFTGTDALDCCRQFIAWYRASRPDAGDGTGET